MKYHVIDLYFCFSVDDYNELYQNHDYYFCNCEEEQILQRCFVRFDYHVINVYINDDVFLCR